MRLLLFLLVACSDPQSYVCTTEMTCGDAVYANSLTVCGTQEAEAQASSWWTACFNLTGFYGCVPWACEITCRSVGECP